MVSSREETVVIVGSFFCPDREPGSSFGRLLSIRRIEKSFGSVERRGKASEAKKKSGKFFCRFLGTKGFCA